MVKKLIQSFASGSVILSPSGLLSSALSGVLPVIAWRGSRCVIPLRKSNRAPSASQRREGGSQAVLFQCRVRKMFLDSPSISGSPVICAGGTFLLEMRRERAVPHHGLCPFTAARVCKVLSCSWSCVIRGSV